MSRERVKLLLNSSGTYVDGAANSSGHFKVNVENSALAVTSSSFATLAEQQTQTTHLSQIEAAVETGVPVTSATFATAAGVSTVNTTLTGMATDIGQIEALLGGTLTVSSSAVATTSVFTGASYSNTNLSAAHDSGTAPRVEHSIAGNAASAATLTLHVSADGTTYYASSISSAVSGDFVMNFVCAFRYYKLKCSDIATTSIITAVASSK